MLFRPPNKLRVIQTVREGSRVLYQLYRNPLALRGYGQVIFLFESRLNVSRPLTLLYIEPSLSSHILASPLFVAILLSPASHSHKSSPQFPRPVDCFAGSFLDETSPPPISASRMPALQPALYASHRRSRTGRQPCRDCTRVGPKSETDRRWVYLCNAIVSFVKDPYRGLSSLGWKQYSETGE
jgi:hypothetical protein